MNLNTTSLVTEVPKIQLNPRQSSGTFDFSHCLDPPGTEMH